MKKVTDELWAEGSWLLLEQVTHIREELPQIELFVCFQTAYKSSRVNYTSLSL